jgi:hypothetical protein
MAICHVEAARELECKEAFKAKLNKLIDVPPLESVQETKARPKN